MGAPIAYQLFDGSNGLQLSNGLLTAYRDGVETARTELAAESPPLGELLASYRVPQLLAAHAFAFDGVARQVDVVVSVDFPLPSSLGGHLICDGQDGYWSAERRGANRFLMADQLPDLARPYAQAERRGEGWRIELPSYVREYNDPVLRKRIGVGLERLLYRLADDKVEELPYRFRVDNVFSVSQPMWAEALPWIADDISDKGR